MNDVAKWDIGLGERLPRQELHNRYGGNRRRGISPSRSSPNVFLFSVRHAAARHGYVDDLEADPVEYYGEGQTGDMEFTHGNLAILTHRDQGRALRLFVVEGREVEYLGEYELDSDDPYVFREASQTNSSINRKAIVFRLRRVE